VLGYYEFLCILDERCGIFDGRTTDVASKKRNEQRTVGPTAESSSNATAEEAKRATGGAEDEKQPSYTVQ